MGDLLLMLIAVSIVGAALISAKSGVATILLEITAGFVLGIFFTDTLPSSIEALSELGLITLMFLAGLEVDFSFIRKKGKQGIALGIYTFAVSFAIIGLLCWWVLDLTALQTVLIATALSECSVGVVYPILRQKGELGPRRKIILSAVMVMEFIGVSIISIAFSHVTWYGLAVLAFIVLTWRLYPVLRKKYRSLKQHSAAANEHLTFKFVLALLLVASFLANSSGIDAVLIVFILGMLLAPYISNHPSLYKKIETISFGFLTPLFFFSVGYHVPAEQVFSVLPTILLVTTIAFSTTYIVSYMPAKKFLPKRKREIGFLLNAPLIVGVIASTIGRDQNILSQELYVIVLCAVILSSFITAVFTKYPAQKGQQEAGSLQ